MVCGTTGWGQVTGTAVVAKGGGGRLAGGVLAMGSILLMGEWPVLAGAGYVLAVCWLCAGCVLAMCWLCADYVLSGRC